MADESDLRRTIAALRQEVPMRAEWRVGVMRDIATAPRPDAQTTPIPMPRRAGWTLRPLTAVAAGVLCAVGGGALTLGVQRAVSLRNPTPSTVASPNDPALGPPVRFGFVAPAASTVAIVGDFNGWSPTASPMRRTAAGLWSIDLPLSAGRHTYAFVVDGVLVADPNALGSADDDYGVPSSVVLVSRHKST